MKTTDILAVVVSFNGLERTALAVNALLDKIGHVHIVDNGSDTESVSIVGSLVADERVSVTWYHENRGVGHALNVGVTIAKQLGYSWLLTMDQDSIVDGQMLENYCKAIGENSALVCLTPNLSFGLKREQTASSFIEHAITSGNLVNLNIFDVTGLYSEEMFVDCIDFDFSLRVRKAGYTIYKVHDAHMSHQLGETMESRPLLNRIYTRHPPLRRYYMFRNHMYMFEKYICSFPLFILKLTLSNLMLLLLIPVYDKKPLLSLSFIFRGIRDYFKGVSGMYRGG